MNYSCSLSIFEGYLVNLSWILPWAIVIILSFIYPPVCKLITFSTPSLSLLQKAGPYTISLDVQWWFVYPDMFVPGRYFRINKFSGLLNCPLVRTWKSVPTLFVRTSEISGLSEPRLTNLRCSSFQPDPTQDVSLVGHNTPQMGTF